MNAVPDEQPVWIYMTAPHKRQARHLIKALLEAKLVACANFMEQWSSMYWWEGKIQEDRETIIIAKSLNKHFPAIEAMVKKHSGYDCPCVLALPVVNGHHPYLEWLKEQVNSPAH